MKIGKIKTIKQNNCYNVNNYQITMRNIINRYQYFVLPVHLSALHAHQSRSGLLAGAEGRGSKIDNHEIHRETWRIYLEAQRGSNSCPIFLHRHS